MPVGENNEVDTSQANGTDSASGAGAAGGGDTAGGGDKPQTVSYARFAEVVADKNKAVADLAGLRASVTELKAGHSTALEKLQGEVTTATDRATKLEADKTWSDNMVDLARDGIHDKEITDYLRYKYDTTKMEEGKEKPPFGDWYTEYKATEPTVLQSFMGGNGAGSTSTGQPKGKAPKATEGTSTPKNANSVDASRINSMSREEYAAQRDALLKSVR